MKCPVCKSESCKVINEISTEGKDFSAPQGCCGALLLGPMGLLCGLCGQGKKIKSEHYWLCESCGTKFKV